MAARHTTYSSVILENAIPKLDHTVAYVLHNDDSRLQRHEIHVEQWNFACPGVPPGKTMFGNNIDPAQPIMVIPETLIHAYRTDAALHPEAHKKMIEIAIINTSTAPQLMLTWPTPPSQSVTRPDVIKTTLPTVVMDAIITKRATGGGNLLELRFDQEYLFERLCNRFPYQSD